MQHGLMTSTVGRLTEQHIALVIMQGRQARSIHCQPCTCLNVAKATIRVCDALITCPAAHIRIMTCITHFTHNDEEKYEIMNIYSVYKIHEIANKIIYESRLPEV